MSAQKRLKTAHKAESDLIKRNKPGSVPSFTRSFLLLGFLAVFTSALYNYYGSQRNFVALPKSNNLRDSFEVVDLPGKGKGVIAIRDIMQGEPVLREHPLFVLPPEISTSPTTLISHSLQQLSDHQRGLFYNLSYVHFPGHLNPGGHPEEVALAIFQTNAVAAGTGVGIFPRMARLNHGCSKAFNVVYSWREQEGSIVVHALKDIAKGEELLTTYTDTKRSRHERRDFLLRHYDFFCACSVCSLEDAESIESDTRLTTMSELYKRLSSWGHGAIDGIEAINLAKTIWALGNEEEYWSERGQLAADAAWVAAAHSDRDATHEWAELAIKWFTYELGYDSEQVTEMLEVIQNPESHSSWGTRERLYVGSP